MLRHTGAMAWRRPTLFAAGWLIAVALAVAVGVLTVTLLAASMKDRGPIGTVSEGDPAGVPPSRLSPAPRTTVTEIFQEEFGEFEVACEGVSASTVAVRPAPGWHEVSHETGPDDDVDAVFADGARKAEITVFCNRGRPTLDEVEVDTLGSD